MANFNNNANVHDGAAVDKWISQIQTASGTYDIATHHSIKFVEGGEETTWNGLTDLTVVIPTIQDIVQTPIEFAGTVGADGVVAWNATHTDGPKTGYLVFVTADCTFGDLACEAGDMAIYDGAKWNIVSGENQVKITGTTNEAITEANRTVVAVGAAKDVLEVEGKALALTLDYANLGSKEHLTVSKGGNVEVKLGDMTVGEAYIKLNHVAGEAKTLVSDKTITYGTELADGKVTFTGAESLVNGITFGTLKGGEVAKGNMNTLKKLSVEGGALFADAGKDFVKSVSFSDVTFVPADESDTNKITMVTGLTEVSGKGKQFFNGITKVEEDNVEGDFTVMGYYAPETPNTTFVEGLKTGNSVLTGISTAGSINTVEGDTFVTGLTGGVSAVVTAVSVNAPADQDVLSSAKVENNVLVLGTAKAVKSVSVTPTTTTFTKTGISYTPATFTSSEFKTSGFTHVSDVKYTFGKANETTYAATSISNWKLNTPELGVSYGSYTINHDNMKAIVDADTFVVSVNGGSFPTLTSGSFTKATLTGTVGTALTTASVVVREVAAEMDKITLPGTYTLASASKGDEGAIAVGAAGKSITVASTVIDLSGYVTNVTIQ